MFWIGLLVFTNVLELAVLLLLIVHFTFLEKQHMTDAAALTTSFNNLSTAVSQLLAAKQNGIDPATLDPIKAGMDQLTAQINADLTPAAPAAG
jgi:hypothetical protein